MQSRSRILTVAGIAVIGLAGILGTIMYRAQTANANYESQCAKWWALAAGGYEDFSNQVLSMKLDASSQAAVCHNTKVQLQNLNSISLAGEVPPKHKRFHTLFMDAVSENKRYYRTILEIHSKGSEADGVLLSSLFTLGKDVEDRYRDARNSMPDIGTEIDPGTYAKVNAHLSKIFQPAPKPAPKPRTQTRIVVVPRSGYSPGSPPVIRSFVTVQTPRGGPLNFRTAPYVGAERIAGRDRVEYGERVMVLDRYGDWLYIMTEEGTTGYIRWWYQGDSYVVP